VGRDQSIHLRIRTEWALHEFHLKPGDSLVAGRSPNAQIPVPRQSVSVEHLKITWDGTELKIQDLNSSNGTFRMPQDSPFIEANFPPKFDGLVLRLSKSLIEVSWQPFHSAAALKHPSAIDATRTEVGLNDSNIEGSLHQLTRTVPDPLLSTEKTLGGVLDPSTHAGVFSESAHDRTQSMPGAAIKQVTASSAGSELGAQVSATDSHSQARPAQAAWSPTREELLAGQRAAAWLLLSAAALALLVLSLVAGAVEFAGITRVPQLILRTGGMIDVVMLWIRALEEQAPLLLGGLVVSVVVARIFVRGAQKNPNAWVERWGASFARAKFPRATSLRLLSFVFLVMTILWPGVWGLAYGVRPGIWGASIRYWRIVDQKNLSNADSVKELRSLLPALEGSSLLYKNLFEKQRLRVVKECGGIGDEAPWENKKICLVLLAAVGIETLEETRPALLGDIAARAAVLMSLDGITRVITTEGLKAPTIPFFLNSLDAVGLGAEQEDIAKLIYTGGLDSTQAGTALRGLRSRVEQVLQDRQLELKYPKVLSFQVPGPLETGI
jgi:hypothetical protein